MLSDQATHYPSANKKEELYHDSAVVDLSMKNAVFIKLPKPDIFPMSKLETVETPKIEAIAKEVVKRNDDGKRTGCIPKIRTLENILYYPQLPESLHRQARRNHILANPVCERHLALFVIVLIFFLLPF